MKPGFIRPKVDSEYAQIKQIASTNVSEVWMVKRKKDDQIFAMKKIKTYMLSKPQIQQAKDECSLLSILNSPFIIAYETSFDNYEENCLCIVMEYGKGGNEINGTDYETDCALFWKRCPGFCARRRGI